MTDLPIVRTTILHPYVAFADNIGLPHDALLRHAGLPVFFEDFPDSWVPHTKVQLFIDEILHREPEAE